MSLRLRACYRVRSDAQSIESRALTIAVEQSVEMPTTAIRDAAILSDIVARVAGIEDRGDGSFAVGIDLAVSTTGREAGQFLNMLFGNTSLQDDVTLDDIILPDEFLAAFGGPRHGVGGLRGRVKGEGRALTCSALKPQGLSAGALAELAYDLTLGGLDFLKDDHGLADQSYSPFAERVRAIAAAVRKACAITGRTTRYIPSLSGHLGNIEHQLDLARAEGIDTVMIAPMLAGVSALHALTRSHTDFAFIAHPTMIGAARISPVVVAKLFRLFGADGAIFPNHGGRFSYSPQICANIASALLRTWGDLRPSLPVPAGGMSVQRVPEMLNFYGKDAILLIGGGLLAAPKDKITDETARFVRAVAEHDYGSRHV